MPLLTQWTNLNEAELKSLTASAVTDVPSSDTLTITCLLCGDSGPEGSARAFAFGPTLSKLCNVPAGCLLMNSDAVKLALIHELMHIYDIWTRQMDLQDCQQLAYLEVRAAQEGEC